MRTRPSPRSFGGGELAPWLDGITSEVTAKGCRTLENFIVMKQGPITRRPGTFWVSEAKNWMDHADCESTTLPAIVGATAQTAEHGTFGRSDVRAHTGTYSYRLMITSAGTSCWDILSEDNTELYGYKPGDTAAVSSWVYVPSVVSIALTEITINLGDDISADYGTPTVYDAWCKVTAKHTFNTGCIGARVYVNIDAAASINEYCYFDDFELTNPGTVLIPCTIDDDNSYVIEAGDSYLRFYKNHVQVSLAGSAYEVTSPWSAGDVTDLRWCYIPDEKSLYLAHPAHPLERLRWVSDASWFLEQANILKSPDPIVMNTFASLVTSPDGKTWTEKRSPYDPANTIHSALGMGRDNIILTNASNTVIGSEIEGMAVTGSSTAINQSWDIVGNAKGEVVAVGKAPSTQTSGSIHVSYDDGQSWALWTGPASGVLYAVEVDQEKNSWMAVGRTSRMWSRGTEGAWTSITESSTLFGLDYGSDLWVAGGVGVIKITSSITGAFTSITMTGTIYGIAHGMPSNTDLWVAAGETDSGNAVIYTSPTGTIWTQQYNSNTYAGAIKDVAWLDGIYLAVGGAGGGGLNNPVDAAQTGTIFATSYDGVTWTVDTTLSRTNCFPWYKIAYRNPEDLYDLITSSHFPKCASYHEGRFILGPTTSKPSTLWGSRTNVVSNFYLGEFADQAWSYSLSSERNVDIMWVIGGMGGLAVGTRTAEGMLVGSESEGITPNTAQFKWQSTFGSDNVQPVRVHDYIIFAQRGGEIIRGYAPGAGAKAYQSPDLTQYADHIAEGGVHEFDHQDDPQTVVYAVRHDGQLLALTFEGATVAWSRIVTDGVIESVAVIPTAGAEDEVWCVVNRTIGAATKRYVEYFDTLKVASKEAAHFVDCGYENAACASATVYANVMSQLAGEYVDVLINGNVVEHSKLVTASGTITISNTKATHIHAGLPCPAYAQTMRMETGSSWGAGMGLSKRNANLLVWVHDTMGGEYGPLLSTTEAVTFSATSALTTDLLEVNFPGTWDRDGYIWVCQRDPLPMTVVAVAPDIETGDD
jgi:hypothetical protein